MERTDANVPDITEQAAELVLRAAEGEAGAEEELPQFAARSPEHLKYLLLHIALHQDLGELSARSRPAAHRRVAVSVAAALLLGLGMLFGTYGPVVALPGYARSVTLSDGSLMQLNGGSVAHPEFSGIRRKVTLWSGEALFDVEHDLLRPFTVSAGNTTLHATGTTFDVSVLSTKVTVTVAQGRVELEKHCESSPSGADYHTHPAQRTVTLQAGEQASVSSDGCIHTRPKLDSAELDRQLAWSHERLDLRNEPLKKAVNRFNRYNRKQLLIRDATVEDVVVPGVFDSKDVDSFVAALRLLGVKVVSQQGDAGGNAVFLVGRDCEWNGVRCINR
jgi:transmembrane sensor